LLEAKAHAGELSPNDCCCAANKDNRKRINQVIEEASKNFGNRWSLTAAERYQLSNRFAWASKIAALGKPVILVYLGFLNAYETNQPFHNHARKQCTQSEYEHFF
jgi:hypothetical protein